MSGIRRRGPKRRIRRCEASVCNEVASRQLLGVRSVGLHVFNVCTEHYRERFDSELEETYLRTYRRLGKWGIEELDDYFKKKLIGDT